MKKIILFVVPLVLTAALVVGYFKVAQKISTIKVPALPSVSLSDLVKYSKFSLSMAPSQALSGGVDLISGEVNYEARTATVSAKISSATTVQQGESLSTGPDGMFTLTINGGVEIVVSPDTTLAIVQTLPADLVFAQNSGTAEYSKLADIPVTIRSLHLLIENGGEITVSVDKIKPIVTVSVKKGTASVAYNNINNDMKIVTIQTGKTLTFNDSTRKAVLK